MIVSDRYELEIEKILRERTGRECIFVPSGRMGIYLALVSPRSTTTSSCSQCSRPACAR